MFNQDGALPQEVNIPGGMIQPFNGLFKTADLTTVYAENMKKIIPKSFSFGVFGGFIFPFFGEMDSAVFDFVPGEGREVELRVKANKSAA
jgi:hypothetical protein